MRQTERLKKLINHGTNNSLYVNLFCALNILALNVGIIVLVCASLSDIRDQYEILGLAFICTLQLTLSIVHLTGAFSGAYASLLAINAVNNFVEVKTATKKILFKNVATRYIEYLFFFIYSAEFTQRKKLHHRPTERLASRALYQIRKCNSQHENAPRTHQYKYWNRRKSWQVFHRQS